MFETTRAINKGTREYARIRANTRFLLRNDSYFGAVHADQTCTRELANPYVKCASALWQICQLVQSASHQNKNHSLFFHIV